jgi:phosphatidylglycerol:prolipoprotein diacylglycerol transferase
MAIEFPDISPFVFQIGAVGLRWYSLAYVAGFILAWVILLRLSQKPSIWGGPLGAPAPFSRDDVDELIYCAVLGVILGGRIGFVLLYRPEMFADPISILRVWEGGMSFHGGLMGVCLAVMATALTRKIPLWRLADAAALVAPFGLLFGRIANFVNQELWGRPTDVPWAFIFQTDSLRLARHPSTLYQAAMEGLLLAALVWGAARLFGSLKRPGLTTGLFMIGYATARAIGEQFREPDAYAPALPGFLTLGTLYSLPMALFGIWLIARAAMTKTDRTNRIGPSVS